MGNGLSLSCFVFVVIFFSLSVLLCNSTYLGVFFLVRSKGSNQLFVKNFSLSDSLSVIAALLYQCENRVLPSQMNGRMGTTLKNSSG